jgi:succinate-semialdehyde dehydrogenase/glutarate-semialdehyde dehydrogenase
MAIASVNPATGEVLRIFEHHTSEQVNQKLELAKNTFSSYQRTSFKERAEWMRRASKILDDEKEEFGRLMTIEMGKPLTSAIAEASKCAWVCRYYAEHAEKFLDDEIIETNATRSYLHYQPLGPILAVMPWNFPFWQVFRFAAPALMAGNIGLLKHASNVPQCALAIESIFQRAGFPEGAFQTLLIGSDAVEFILADPRVRAATLTGSEPAGSSVASLAGKYIKKTVLELGGSDPFIVMPSADLDEAVHTAVKARTINNGQSCIAAKRFIISKNIAAEFVPRFVKELQTLKVGDPLDKSTDIGPLATSEILADLDQQVRKTIVMGGKVLTGGKQIEGDGYYYPPTAITHIPKDSPAYHEELFGPVASIFEVHDIDEAISLANATNFGLGSSAWTNDPAEQTRFIEEIDAGQVFINGMVASDPRLPFGGVNHSGYGRELSVYGIREFVNIKTVWIRDMG